MDAYLVEWWSVERDVRCAEPPACVGLAIDRARQVDGRCQSELGQHDALRYLAERGDEVMLALMRSSKITFLIIGASALMALVFNVQYDVYRGFGQLKDKAMEKVEEMKKVQAKP